MLRHTISIAVLLLGLGAPLHAQEDWGPAPDHLTIGYEDEGKVDASPSACEALVRGLVEWSEDDIRRGVERVCRARQRHVDAYRAIQKSYKVLKRHIEEDGRLNPGGAARNIAAMVRACIDHKWALTTGGHNITIDIIPNDIAANCLELGTSVLDQENNWFASGATDDHPTP